MPNSGVVKYLVRLKFEVEGVVEKADLIGAIFGQTEGLFGPSMNLHELQKTWKVGRIEVDLSSKDDKTYGNVTIPMSTDISTAAMIAAAVESVDKVGPCSARFQLLEIEDARVVKKKAIVDRAKEIVKEWSTKITSEGEGLLKDVTESVRRAKVVTFGKEDLPAGPGVYTSDTVYLVEGRADVINLLRAGIENVIAIEGTSIPDSIIRLSKEKNTIAFLDGDRAGDLILKELQQVAKMDKVLRAPYGREVEDLTPVEVLEIVRGGPAPQREVAKVQLPEALEGKVREVYPLINGTLEAEVLDGGFKQLARVPVSELVQRLESMKGAEYVLFDGIVTQRLVDVCSKGSVKFLVGHRVGDMTKKPAELAITTFSDLGLE